MINYPAKLIKRTLHLLCAKNFILFILICLFAHSVAGAVSGIISERTLGSVFRHFLPTTPYLFLIILNSLYDIRKFSFSGLAPNIPSDFSPKLFVRRYLLIVFLAVLVGQFSFQYLMHLGLLYLPVIILVITGLIFSCYYMLLDRKILGVIIFLVVYPFLFFIQKNFGKITNYAEYSDLSICEAYIPLSAIYIFTISMFYFIAKYLSRIDDANYEDRKFIRFCLVFGLLAVPSTILSNDPCNSFVYCLMEIILPLVYFLILMKSLRNLEDIKMFILALVVSVFLYEFLALYFASQKGSVNDNTTGLYGFGAREGFAVTLIPLMIPFQVAFYKLLKGWKKVSIGLILIMFIVYLFLSNSRTSVLAALVGGIIFICYYRVAIVKKIYFSIVVLLFVVIAFMSIDSLYKRLDSSRFIQMFEVLSSGATLADLSSNRFLIWKSAFEMIHDYPVFGIGPGMWSEYIPQYSRTNYLSRDFSGRITRYYSVDPHNIYLLIYVNYGIASLICYLVILYMAVKRGLLNIRKRSSNIIRFLSLGSFISLIVWIVEGLFSMRFIIYDSIVSAIIFWSIIAVILKINEFNSMKNINTEYVVQEK